jgi:SAM-dependent methyltransferase
MDQYSQIAAYYDLEHSEFTDDIDLYLNLIVAGPVLEIGAGSGRITRALAKAGHEVWAVDSSQAMLELAEREIGSHAGVHLIHSRVEELVEGDPLAGFRVAILSLNFLWHLPDWESQLQALRAVHHQVVHSALVIIDLSNPLTMTDRGARGEVRERFRWSGDDREILATAMTWDDPAEQSLSVTLVYDEWGSEGIVRRAATELSLRYIYRFELELLLHLSGFTLELLYGSYDLEAYRADSPNLIAVCRAEKQ